MRKYFIVLCLLLSLSLISCKSTATNIPAANDNRIKVTTTIWPIYDWVKNIAGDNVNVEYLLKSGVDLHNYQPSADDILRISKSDIFIYVGGESDEWVEDVFKNSPNPERTEIYLLNACPTLLEEEMVEGMQGEAEDESEEDAEHYHIETEYDEHVWLSIKNTKEFVQIISEALCEKDPDNETYYTDNANKYCEMLDELDGEYRSTVDNATNKTLLFGDRFPFRYMTDEYGLDYYAAFIGCSAETEASFETIKFLADKVDELELKNILVIEGSDHKIAEAIKSNTKTKDQAILSLNSMQSMASDNSANNSYLQIMRDNLSVLKEVVK